MRWWNLWDVGGLFWRGRGSKAEGTSTWPTRDPPGGASSPNDAKTQRISDATVALAQPSEPDVTQSYAPPEKPRSEDGAIAKTMGTEASASGEADLAGVSVPGYDILEELGRGGMGVVYRARHQSLRREVALKMILAGAHAGKPGRARFRAEAAAVARLQHPNIVQVFEIGEHEGCPYFSLEFVDGGSLSDRIRQSPLSPRAAARLLESLARAIDFAHQRGVLHRDLKPANILLSSLEGRSSAVSPGSSLFRKATAPSTISDSDWSASLVPKIADFGLAKRLDEDSGQTHSGTVLGTPSYMSPEQAGGKTSELGPRTDIYALGAILYELLVGRPPFKANNPIDTIRQVIGQEPVSPRQLEPRVPWDLETICLKCLEKQPARRYSTANELADDLHRFLADEPILARPISTTERVRKWAKRRPSTVALIGVCLAAAIAGVTFIAWHNVSLRDRLDRALAEERQARRQAAEAEEKQRLSQLEIEGQRLYGGARLAVAAGDLPKARLELTKALTALRGEPQLDALRQSAEAVLAEVERRLGDDANRLASRERLGEFAALRDEAQFLGALYTGMELDANLKAAREAIHRALAVYGVSADGDARLARDPYLNDADHVRIFGDCYQLVLILAETEAQSSSLLDAAQQPGRLREALRVLDQAPRFGDPSRAYYLRRARYLHSLGDRDAAAQAEQLAAATPVSDGMDHFLIADERYRRGDYDEAIDELEDVLQIQPDHFWAQYLSGLCLLRENRTAEARIYLSACLAQGRDFVWLYLLRGFANGELQDFAAADADFQAAFQRKLDDNSRYVLLVNRGVLRIREERFDEAIDD